jgi:hypothetical protein
MWGLRKSIRGGEFAQSTLYACMERSQWNHFLQIICLNNNKYIYVYKWKDVIIINTKCQIWLAEALTN